MNAIDEALFIALSNDAALAGQLPGGVHYQRAPQGASGRLAVYQLQSRTPAYVHKGRAYDRLVYNVKVVDTGEDNAAALTAFDRIDALLTDQAWFAGIMVSRLANATEYADVADGVTYQYVAGLWNVEVQA